MVELPERWQELQDRADAPFFLSWDWIGCWLRETGVTPWVMEARFGGSVVALALLQPHWRRSLGLLRTRTLLLNQTGQPALDSITIEYNGLLVDRDHVVAARRACLDHLVQQKADGPEWDELTLGGVTEPERVRQLGASAGLMDVVIACSASWAVDLVAVRAAGGDYLAQLSRNTRQQINRSVRLYEARGPLAAEPARTVAEALVFLDRLKVLHQRYWISRGEAGAFARPFFEQFHRALITDCLARGTVEVVCVRAGAEPIGFVYNFIRDGWVCAYQTGFVYEDDARLKPGLVSHYLCIRRHIEAGARRYDFLAGGDRYKASLARRGPDIATVILQRPILRLKAEQAARLVKRKGLPGLVAAWRGVAARPAQPRKVLVLGDDTRSFLAIVRSLGRKGIQVHAAPASFASPALRSRYLAKTHFLPFWMGDGSAWLRAMVSLLQQERFDLVIPCDETTLLPLQHYRAQLEALTRLAIPEDRCIEVLFDKQRTRDLAQSAGVPVAPGRLPRDGDDAETIIAELGLPVVVKTRRSFQLRRLHARGRVRVLESEAALAAALPMLDPTQDLLEGWLPGQGAGLSVLAHEGRLLQVFEHRRVRETLAGSYYRVSADVTPSLLEATGAIVQALRYTGVAMFEFRVWPGGHVLLEVNARPWGSLPLPVSLGVDFPWLWYRLLVDGVEEKRAAYRAGVFGRNLVPDLLATVSDLRAGRMGARRKLAMALARGAELLRVAGPNEVHDVWVRDDPGPAMREMGGLGHDVLARLTRGLREAGRHLGLAAWTRRRLVRILRSRRGEAVRVAFVCQGNVCRSPFAAAALLREMAGTALQVQSFGMLASCGRKTPENGLEAAAERGLDLSEHRSAHLSREAADAATVLLVFDETNRQAIRSRYPGLATPVLSLGDFAATPLIEIADPWGRGGEAYRSAYDNIGAAVAGLASWIRRGMRA